VATIDIVMPALSPTMTEGRLSRWLKREGDEVKKGEAIAEIETDKTVLEVEALCSGRLTKILVSAGTEAVPVNHPIALLTAMSGARETTPPVIPNSSAKGPVASEEEAGASPQLLTQKPNDSRPLASPRARRMIAELGLQATNMQGSGPGGRIVAADVERAVARRYRAVEPAENPGSQALAARAPDARAASLPHSVARKSLARRLVEAKQQIPHFYVTMDYAVDELLAVRARFNELLATDARLSLNDFVIRACALTLRDVPAINVMWSDEAMCSMDTIDIAIAVATADGLITPVIRNADTKSLLDISREARKLAQRARARRLQPHEYQGGGFTISNLGMFGVREFSAIINPPQAAILAVGAAEPRPAIVSNSLAVATMMTCTLSCDHRVIDGATAAKFLGSLRAHLSAPLADFSD
jgi:pyruvate dehydrogenase E2 component (dihydrolipoamide acetyltransferase)